MVVIHDGLDGPERSRFETQTRVVEPRLSADGAKLLVLAPGNGEGNTAVWLGFDTATGQRQALIPTAGCCDLRRRAATTPALLDPDAWRLYQLATPAADAADSRELVAYNLSTGAELRRAALPDDVAGIWHEDRPEVVDDRYVEPGIALSPDGWRLAIVHSDLTAVSLIDTSYLVVERTFAIDRQRGWYDRLAALLPLPRGADAKGAAEGTTQRATFGQDGRFLYVFGFEETGYNELNRPTFTGLGLQVVDLEGGTLVAEALPGAQIERVIPAPHGASLYVVGPEEADAAYAGWGPVNHVLRRLDASTLSVLAERPFYGERQILLEPGANAEQ